MILLNRRHLQRERQTRKLSRENYVIKVGLTDNVSQNRIEKKIGLL